MDEGGIGVMNEGGGKDRGGSTDRDGSTDRGGSMDKGSVTDKCTAIGGGITDESVHAPFTLFGGMLVFPLLFPMRTVCIYTL